MAGSQNLTIQNYQSGVADSLFGYNNAGNSTTHGSGGGIFYDGTGNVTLLNTQVTENGAYLDGGGLCAICNALSVSDDGTTSLVDFQTNTATGSSSGAGGGIWAYVQASSTINQPFHGNSASNSNTDQVLVETGTNGGVTFGSYTTHSLGYPHGFTVSSGLSGGPNTN